MSSQNSRESGSQYLSPRRSPTRPTLSTRRSKPSLHGDGAARGASLAHELAAALMPEPTASSTLFADEFGIEFDEGAEGIEDDGGERRDAPPNIIVDGLENAHALQPETGSSPNGYSLDLMNSRSSNSRIGVNRTPHHDSPTIFNTDVEETSLFIEALRRLDSESSGPLHTGIASSEPPLERLASDVIRRINDSAREREGQVRELREFEKEFRRIAGQAGGQDLLGELDELEQVEDFPHESKEKHSRQESTHRVLSIVQEEDEPSERRDASADWELDPQRVLGDDVTVEYDDPDRPDSPSPVKDSSSLLPPPFPSIPTPANTVAQLTYLRIFTQSLISSLSVVVEQTQVTGAATAEAGRKIRALKNKIGGWREEWESAERSMEKIEKWEAGGSESPFFGNGDIPNGPGRRKGRKMKQIMQEELSAFELVLAEAGRKTQAIMAAS